MIQFKRSLYSSIKKSMDSSPPLPPLSPTPLPQSTLFHHHHHHHPPLHHHHHHYHLHPSPHCPFHNSMLQPITHLPTCPLSTSHDLTTQNELPIVPSSFQNDPDSHVFEYNEAIMDAQMMQDENEQFEEEDDDEEPVFVLTDEWREFFAKSEAKRKLAKKQAKKKGKKFNE